MTSDRVIRDASIASRGHLLPGLGHGERQPRWALRAQGAYVHADDGVDYLDLLCGYGSVILGHSDDEVSAAVASSLRLGVSPTWHTSLQLDLADALHDRIPGAEMSLFLKSGSDATGAAVRLARGISGRRHVLQYGYHGWHDWCAPRRFGVIEPQESLVHKLRFNDTEHLADLVGTYGGDLAAIIVMPLETCEPSQDWLMSLREHCNATGALLIFDEIRSGFRMARGGAQEKYNLNADLVTMSKAMANGHPISAVSGSAKLLTQVSDMSVSSVFFRSRDGFAAALATLQALDERGTVEHLWSLGEILQNGMGKLISEMSVPARITGVPPMPHHEFLAEGHSNEKLNEVFTAAALQKDVLFHPSHHWFVSGAMTTSDIDLALEGARHGYAAVADYIAETGSRP